MFVHKIILHFKKISQSFTKLILVEYQQYLGVIIGCKFGRILCKLLGFFLFYKCYKSKTFLCVKFQGIGKYLTDFTPFLHATIFTRKRIAIREKKLCFQFLTDLYTLEGSESDSLVFRNYLSESLEVCVQVHNTNFVRYCIS